VIKFPRVHIAESVQNRILNANAEIELGRMMAAPPPPPVPPPDLPDTTLPSALIDAKVATPVPADVPPLEAPPEPPAGERAGMVARGDDLISA